MARLFRIGTKRIRLENRREHPTLDALYCVNETSGTLAAFAVEPATTALQELQYEPLMPCDFRGIARAADVHITPDGNFIYASVRIAEQFAVARHAPDVAFDSEFLGEDRLGTPHFIEERTAAEELRSRSPWGCG